ncbi:ABC-type transport auxiliary lipoprotein family protein [Vitreimonas flagellata]|uniref:ABC-type transport auxiliary lipoprotein family protein n=1 Tax=Vitreimonas flagellata TaxID=2560861 RepID=UPI001075644F|nr:ABC-type transport auxiliary lipoprotein family protein [Vitreimonas flagellata]
MMRASIFLLPLVLGGCISLLPEPPPPPRVFVLEAADVAPLSQRIDATIAVAQPTGERTIMGTDVIWRTGDELAYVAQTQWSARSEFALQNMLIHTLARQGAFSAATRAGEGRAHYEVRWDVLDFEVREDSMQARFVADVRIVASPGRRIIAQRVIEAEAPVSDRSSSIATQALARAAREGAARIGVFAAEAASADQATQQPAAN